MYILQKLLGIVNETANVYFKGKLSKISPVDVSRLQTTTHRILLFFFTPS